MTGIDGRRVTPHGLWSSPISARALVQGAANISEVKPDPVIPGLVWWGESRPDERGRIAVMCCYVSVDTETSPNTAHINTAHVDAANIKGAVNIHGANINTANITVSEPVEITPPTSNVRTRVHEYGGGAWWPHNGVLYYVEHTDQRLRRLNVVLNPEDRQSGHGQSKPRMPDVSYSPRCDGKPITLTAEPAQPCSYRYADGQVSKDERWIICVRERHELDHYEPFNELVAIPTDGSETVQLLWSDSDFVMSPRISPCGTKLAWIAWNHPNMPWDSTRLHVHHLLDRTLPDRTVADRTATMLMDALVDSAATTVVDHKNSLMLGDEILVVGADGAQSLCEPGWVRYPDLDRLFVCSDHEDWWQLYGVNLSGYESEQDIAGASANITDNCNSNARLVAKTQGQFDIATPPWVFGMQRWAGNGSVLVAAAGLATRDALLMLDEQTGESGYISDVSDSEIMSLAMFNIAQPNFQPNILAQPNAPAKHNDMICVVYAGASYSHESEVVLLSVDSADDNADSKFTANRHLLRPSRELDIPSEFIVTPEAITFPTFDAGVYAHAVYYAPVNPYYAAPCGELPPLMVIAHGGPTAAARRRLNLEILYWSSRGFAVLDVNYRGSTGYGRQYRQALNFAWGVVDVMDCLAAARFLVERGEVDKDRLLIRGGSAGGFTVLSALTFHDMFAAGASRYGVADLELLAADTHKFESRYLDTLVGVWPDEKKVYTARSPIHHLDNFNTPMIILQGGQDEIVPPSQSEMIVKALKKKGVRVEYVLFPDEQHGFRNAENIITALEAELAFFTSVLST